MSLIPTYGYGTGRGEGLISSFGFGGGSFIETILGATRKVITVLFNQAMKVGVER